MATATKPVKPKARKRRETFGAVRKLPSGRIQASYVGPDGKRYAAPSTYDNLTDARGWLSQKQAELRAGEWSQHEADVASLQKQTVAETVGSYAKTWLDTRVNRHGEPLRARTRTEYERLIAGPLADLMGERFKAITPEVVRAWYAEQLATGRKTQGARAYGLLRAIMATAVQDGRISVNPCMIRGAQNATTGKEVKPPTPAELNTIVNTITERFKAMVLVAAWGGLRFGELTELRRKDLTLVRGDDADVQAILVRVERAVTYTPKAGHKVGRPKTEAGVRTVALPPNVFEAVVKHLDEHTGPGEDALLWPAFDGVSHLSTGTWAKHWEPARAAAKREDLPFHGLRHFGATRFAQTGATIKELQARLGHTTPGAAMRYQHEAGRDLELVALMAKMGA